MFGDVEEVVRERSDYPISKIKSLLGNDTLAVLGYGPQGRGQALNARDHGLDVIIGLREGGSSYAQALRDGWIPGKTLVPVVDAAKKGSVVMYLLSDAGQKDMWSAIKPALTPGKTLYFSHGFSIVFSKDTGVVPPKDVDVVLVAPKGSGYTLRTLFLEGRGLNSSVAIHQNVSGKAEDRAYALATAVGSGYMYETTFQKEVFSDLTGERGVLMGGIQGLFQAQYDVLRAKGHSPSEAFNETVEEATQSLYCLIGEKGMDFMFANCSTTAQRGALDWWKSFYNVSKPVFEKLYSEVENGNEARRTLEKNSDKNYRQELEKELEELRNGEMWRVGKVVRSLRPENQKK
jgi:ketol-acid reductoisomerase